MKSVATQRVGRQHLHSIDEISKAGLGNDTFNVVRSLAPLGQRKVAGAVKYHKIFTQRPCSILVTSYICFMICGLCFNSLLREHPNFGVNQSNCICRSNVAFECFWTAVGYVCMSSNKKKVMSL